MDSSKACLLTMTGGGAVAVDSRMLSTFFRKKFAKLDKLVWVLVAPKHTVDSVLTY